MTGPARRGILDSTICSYGPSNQQWSAVVREAFYDSRSRALQLGEETIVTTSLRRTPDGIRQFEAPSSLAHNLQGVLVDLVELHLQGKQAHWNVIGTNFRDLHLQLDEIVDIAREASDTIAERMRALNAVPDGRSDTVVASTTLPAFPPGEQNTAETVDLITNRIYATVSTIRTVHDAVDAVDPSTSDLLHEIIDSLEKQAWMIKSENRKV
jgi:starvation-inducible DNA-binding protein